MVTVSGLPLCKSARRGVFIHSFLCLDNSCCIKVFPEYIVPWKKAFLFLWLVSVLTWSEAAFGAIVEVSEAAIYSLELSSFEGCAE